MFSPVHQCMMYTNSLGCYLNTFYIIETATWRLPRLLASCRVLICPPRRHFVNSSIHKQKPLHAIYRIKRHGNIIAYINMLSWMNLLQYFMYKQLEVFRYHWPITLARHQSTAHPARPTQWSQLHNTWSVTCCHLTAIAITIFWCER